MKIAHPNRTNQGFTLIEILVVITIIGILSGLLFTGASAAMNSVKKAAAKNTAHNVKNAATAYFTEYRRLPIPEGRDTSSGTYIDFETDESFMDILLGAESTVGKAKNPRGIAFFSGNVAKKTAEGFEKGIAFNSDGKGGGDLYDPFGNLYGVRLDTSNKSRMENPKASWGSAGSHESIITESIAVWSLGKKSGDSDHRDNITTW